MNKSELKKIAFNKYKKIINLLNETKFNFNQFNNKMNETNILFFLSQNIKNEIISLENSWNNSNLKDNNIMYYCSLQNNNKSIIEYFESFTSSQCFNNEVNNFWNEYIKLYRLSILTMIDLDKYMFDNDLINEISLQK